MIRKKEVENDVILCVNDLIIKLIFPEEKISSDDVVWARWVVPTEDVK